MKNITINTKLKVGDQVIGVCGSGKGKIGKILSFSKDKSTVVVEGLKTMVKHEKNGGGRVEMNASVAVSNVAFYDEKSKSASRLSYVEKDGQKLRLVKKSNRTIE